MCFYRRDLKNIISIINIFYRFRESYKLVFIGKTLRRGILSVHTVVQFLQMQINLKLKIKNWKCNNKLVAYLVKIHSYTLFNAITQQLNVCA